MRRDWDALPEGRGPNTSREWYGGDLPGIEQHLDHIEQLGANVIYMTPFFPAGSTHRYDASSFDHVDPLLGGDEAFASLVRAAHARGLKLVGDLTHEPLRRHARLVRARGRGRASRRSGSSSTSTSGCRTATPAWVGVRTLPTLNWRSEELHTRMRAILRHWLDAGLDGWRIDVANMVGRYRDLDVNHDVAAWTRDVVGRRCSSPSTVTTSAPISTARAGTAR